MRMKDTNPILRWVYPNGFRTGARRGFDRGGRCRRDCPIPAGRISGRDPDFTRGESFGGRGPGAGDHAGGCRPGRHASGAVRVQFIGGGFFPRRKRRAIVGCRPAPAQRPGYKRRTRGRPGARMGPGTVRRSNRRIATAEQGCYDPNLAVPARTDNFLWWRLLTAFLLGAVLGYGGAWGRGAVGEKGEREHA